MTRLRLWTSCLLLCGCITAFSACDDDDEKTASGGAKQGDAGIAGRSSAGAGGAGRGGSGAPRPMAMPVACGTSQCFPSGREIPGFVLQQPCCVDEQKGQCGWKAPGGDGTCVAPPPVDSDCPPNAVGQQGCCIESLDRCGIDGSMYAEGCYNLAESMFAVGNPEIFPRTCDGKPVNAGGEDGGVDDGGVDQVDAGR